MKLVTAVAACREPEARSDSFVDIMREAHLMTETLTDTNRWLA
jgi:hypothetical protein